MPSVTDYDRISTKLTIFSGQVREVFKKEKVWSLIKNLKILFLIYITDIGEDLSAKALVYVDGTKISKAKKWVDISNFVLQNTRFPEANVQELSSATHRLLLTIVDATGGHQYGQNRKSVEGFFKNCSWNKRTGLLGKTEDKGDEFGAKKT